MNKLALTLTLFALALPTTDAFAQPGDGRGGPPERDRPAQHDRPEHPRDHDRPRPGKPKPIAVEQIDDAIATLREMHGDKKLPWLDRVEKLAKDKPEEAAKRLSRYPRLRALMDARANRPAEFELHVKQSRLMREVFPLVRKLRQAQKQEDPAKADKLRGKLRERIEALFEVRLKLKEFEIERIRKHLQRAESELANIKADSDKLIDEKMDELMTKGEKPRRPREEGDRPERPRPRPDRLERDNAR